VTLTDERQQYDDAQESGSPRCASPGFDLHSVADSMWQVGGICSNTLV
jgi:hypothetical protein